MAGHQDHDSDADNRDGRKGRVLVRPFLLALLAIAVLGFGAIVLDGEAADDSVVTASDKAAATANEPSGLPARPIVVYHESWDEREVTKAAATTLAVMPAYMNVVALAFDE